MTTATAVHRDNNHQLQQLVNIDQAITWEADYDAFGAATVTTELVSNNHRFPGQYFDAESGLHYNWHRYYDPETGRYTRSDPIGFLGGLNSYRYSKNNPLHYYDSSGLYPVGRWFSILPVPDGTYLAARYLYDDRDVAVDIWVYGHLEGLVECTDEDECGELETWYEDTKFDAPDVRVADLDPVAIDEFPKIYDEIYKGLWIINALVRSEVSRQWAQDPTMYCFD